MSKGIRPQGRVGMSSVTMHGHGICFTHTSHAHKSMWSQLLGKTLVMTPLCHSSESECLEVTSVHICRSFCPMLPSRLYEHARGSTWHEDHN